MLHIEVLTMFSSFTFSEDLKLKFVDYCDLYIKFKNFKESKSTCVLVEFHTVVLTALNLRVLA